MKKSRETRTIIITINSTLDDHQFDGVLVCIKQSAYDAVADYVYDNEDDKFELTVEEHVPNLPKLVAKATSDIKEWLNT